MSLQIISGDLFDTSAEVICHQVNCMGKMGSGVAKQIRSRYPEVYQEYLAFCKEGCGDHFWVLGHSQIVSGHDGKIIVNMFAQSSYGYDGGLYTDYAAFQSCLNEIRSKLPNITSIAMPYKVGCGLGGGDWQTILSYIEDILAPYYEVELWKKEV